MVNKNYSIFMCVLFAFSLRGMFTLPEDETKDQIFSLNISGNSNSNSTQAPVNQPFDCTLGNAGKMLADGKTFEEAKANCKQLLLNALDPALRILIFNEPGQPQVIGTCQMLQRYIDLLSTRMALFNLEKYEQLVESRQNANARGHSFVNMRGDSFVNPMSHCFEGCARVSEDLSQVLINNYAQKLSDKAKAYENANLESLMSFEEIVYIMAGRAATAAEKHPFGVDILGFFNAKHQILMKLVLSIECLKNIIEITNQ